MKNILFKLTLKRGALPAFKKYLRQFEALRAECNASLKGEGTVTENFFLHGNTVYVFKQVKDMARMKRFQKASKLSVYDLVRRMDAECFAGQEKLFSVLDFAPAAKARKKPAAAARKRA